MPWLGNDELYPEIKLDLHCRKPEYIRRTMGKLFSIGIKGLTSPNYPGVLALGDTEFFFDAQGPGSRPWMDPISPFRFKKSEIVEYTLSEEKSFKKKVLTVEIKGGNKYEFLISEEDTFYKTLEEWKKEN